MKCPNCDSKITKDNVVVNDFVDNADGIKKDHYVPEHINETLDIQIICPNKDCETSWSYFVKDTDWTMDH